jgi:hypothetical protein
MRACRGVGFRRSRAPSQIGRATGGGILALLGTSVTWVGSLASIARASERRPRPRGGGRRFSQADLLQGVVPLGGPPQLSLDGVLVANDLLYGTGIRNQGLLVVMSLSGLYLTAHVLRLRLRLSSSRLNMGFLDMLQSRQSVDHLAHFLLRHP